MNTIADVSYSFSINIVDSYSVLPSAVAAGVRRVGFLSSREGCGHPRCIPAPERTAARRKSSWREQNRRRSLLPAGRPRGGSRRWCGSLPTRRPRRRGSAIRRGSPTPAYQLLYSAAKRSWISYGSMPEVEALIKTSLYSGGGASSQALPCGLFRAHREKHDEQRGHHNDSNNSK